MGMVITADTFAPCQRYVKDFVGSGAITTGVLVLQLYLHGLISA